MSGPQATYLQPFRPKPIPKLFGEKPDDMVSFDSFLSSIQAITGQRLPVPLARVLFGYGHSSHVRDGSLLGSHYIRRGEIGEVTRQLQSRSGLASMGLDAGSRMPTSLFG